MNSRTAVAFAALLVMLTGCASAGSPTAAPSSESAESRNKAIASCGVLGKMISGEVPINASNITEMKDTLKGLAETGPGEVKTTAQFVMETIDGKKRSKSESEEQIEKFKSYCMNYTTG